jgi:nitrogen fixation protein FixH
VSHDFREKSDQFNIYQQQRKQQEQLGWSVKLGWKEEAVTGKENILYVQVKDAQGELIKDAQVTAKFMYPADMKLDQIHQLGSDTNGLYQAEITLNNPGDWNMDLNIQHGQHQYEMRTRTTVKQGPK